MPSQTAESQSMAVLWPVVRHQSINQSIFRDGLVEIVLELPLSFCICHSLLVIAYPMRIRNNVLEESDASVYSANRQQIGAVKQQHGSGCFGINFASSHSICG
ncbi:hypothetical protein AWENTII_003551 [Aspergillus wentii]